MSLHTSGELSPLSSYSSNFVVIKIKLIMGMGFHKASLVLLGLFALVSPLALLAGSVVISDSASNEEGVNRELLSDLGNTTSFARKLLLSNDDGKAMNGVVQSTCSKDSISIKQVSTRPTPTGLPSFIIEIANVCTTGCSISNIHVSCGAFGSVTPIDPKVFRRIVYNDCLVNNGGVLRSGESVVFQYANIYAYRLSVSSVKCE